MKLSELWMTEVLGALSKESRVATDEELRELFGDDYSTFTQNGTEMVKVTRRDELDPEVDFVFPRRMPVKDGKIVDLTNICIEYASDSTGEKHEIKMYARCGAYDDDTNEFWIAYLSPTHSLLSITATLTNGVFRAGTDETEDIGDTESIFTRRKISSDGKTEVCHLLLRE